MSALQRRRLAVGGAALATLAAAVVVWLVVSGPSHPGAELSSSPIEVHAGLTPLDGEFADPVTAVVDVFVDTTLVPASSVRLVQRVAPFRARGTTRTETASGPLTRIHFTTRLDCLTTHCVPVKKPKSFRFPDLVVRYREHGRATTARVAWPLLLTHSRLTQYERNHPVLRLGDVHSAAPSFRVDPRRAGTVLEGVAVVLALAGGAILLGLAALPLLGLRRRPSEVEQILRELQTVNGDMPRRRSALEQLARALAPLDGDLSRESRVLAWAPSDPDAEAIADLARRARAVVPQ